MIILINKIRLSLGTAIELGFEEGHRIPNFTTLFLMTYHNGKCQANCAFCPQARESTATSDKLSRISWPEYEFNEVLKKWPSSGYQRICIQTICYDEVVNDVINIVQQLRKISRIPISVAIHPIPREELVDLKEVGVSNIGIALDACTPELFNKMKGILRNSSYRWEKHIEAFKQAQEVFGKGRVTTHLIIGLGESEQEVVDFLFKMSKMQIGVALFAFTSIKGTSLENVLPPDLSYYRRMQVIRHLITNGKLKENQVTYNKQGQVAINMDSEDLRRIISSGKAFQVSGCTGCNRPYYNERPSGSMYNYPRPLNEDELLKAIRESNLVQ